MTDRQLRLILAAQLIAPSVRLHELETRTTTAVWIRNQQLQMLRRGLRAADALIAAADEPAEPTKEPDAPPAA